MRNLPVSARIASIVILLAACGNAGTTESRGAEGTARVAGAGSGESTARGAGAGSGATPAAVGDGSAATSGGVAGGGSGEGTARVAGTAPSKAGSGLDGDFGKSNASGPQLGDPVETGAPQRYPASDLNAQIGGSGARPTAPFRAPATRVTLVSYRVLDSTPQDASKVAARYQASGQSSVKRCYQSALAREPAVTGTLTLRFAITTTGHVADATADSASPALSKCVLAAMPAWTFQAPRADVRAELVLSLVAE